MKKRVIGLLIVAALLMQQVAFAAHFDPVVVEKVNTTGAGALFSATASTVDAQKIRNNMNASVEYSYSVEDIQENDESVHVEMELTLDLGNGPAEVVVAGDPDVYLLDNGLRYISGPLDGEVVISDTNFKVIAGFQKFSDGDDIKVGLTLSAVDGDIPTMYYYFGALYVDPDVVESIYSHDVISSVEEANAMIAAATSSGYALNDEEFGYIDGEEAATVQMLFNRSQCRVMACAIPNLTNMTEHFDPFVGSYSVGVNEVRVWLEQASNSQFHFDGVSHIPGEGSGSGNSFSLGASAAVSYISALLGLYENAGAGFAFDIAISTIESILEELRISVDVLRADDLVEATWDIGDLRDERFDEVPFSVVAHIDFLDVTATSGYARMTANAIIRYRIWQSIPASGSITYYEDSDEAFAGKQIYIS